MIQNKTNINKKTGTWHEKIVGNKIEKKSIKKRIQKKTNSNQKNGD